MAILSSTGTILLVDDELEVLESFELTLNYEGFENVVLCQNSRETFSILSDNPEIEVILLDLSMPFLSGNELLPILSEKHPQIPVIVVTAINELEIAVECMKAGAFDYLVKPVEKMALVGSVRRAMEKRSLLRENDALKHHLVTGELDHPEHFESIITQNTKLINLFKYSEAIARSTEPVLITGETGVGKELFAKSIHLSSMRNGPFIGVNIAGLDENSFSDMLFGHLKGAFTGADSNREGLVKKASGGTLFLDEIGDLEMSLQIKLLRLIQEGEYYPLGADLPEKCDVRIVAATNINLVDEKNNPQFRRDLFYRLQTHHFSLPPLRERLEDLPSLVNHFMKEASTKLHKQVPHYPEELINLLGCYSFPGNVRELQSMIFDAVSRHTTKTLSLETIRERIYRDDNDENINIYQSEPDSTIFNNFQDLPSLERANYHLIAEALKRSGGNQTIASRFLGITQSALSQRLKKMKL